MKTSVIALVVAAALVLVGCGAGSPLTPLDGADAGYALSGVVVKGPVANATVTAYRVDASFTRGTQLATATADANGQFTLSLPPYSGNVLLVATGGTYTEEAVGNSVKLDGAELEYPLIGYQPGSTVTGLSITPVSHWAAALTRYYVVHGGMTVADAATQAWTHLNAHFGAVDWRTISPTDFAAADGGVQLGDADRAGLLLAALSQEAADIASKDQVTPGVGFTSMDLVVALADDLSADGFFDGVGSGGPIVVPSGAIVVATGASGTTLDGQTLRNGLALALSRFLPNPLNRSGLVFSDAESLIDALSADADTVLFRDGGVNFDHTAPIVTPSVAYQLANAFVDGGTPTYAPVGPSRLVGGALRLTLDATDTSGVNSLSALLGGSVLPLDVVGNSNSHLQGTYVTLGSADGPLELSWSATDNKGNTGNGSLTYLVDNTPPAIVVAADNPRDGAFYRTTVPVDATASDNNGIDTYVVTGLDGLNDQDSAKERIAGTWTVPSSVPEGPHDIVFRACDPVHNCATRTSPINIDRLAPAVSFVTPPPQYTAEQQFVLSLNVTDSGSGVAHVYAQNANGGTQFEASLQGDGTYAVALALPETTSTWNVWAVDGAGNSSKTPGLPLVITYDHTPPSVSPPQPMATYYREDQMGVATNADGSPRVPAQYTFPAPTQASTVAGTDVFKASTRLSWGGTSPTAAQLLAQDHSTLNVPFLAYLVDYSAGESPITSVTYTVTCQSNCGPSWTDATGDLLYDPSYSAGLRYLLPLTVETVPGLSQLAAGGSLLSVTVHVTDGAGNSGDAPGTTTSFHVVGPPMVFRVDSSWTPASDSHALAYYRVSSGTYDQAWPHWFTDQTTYLSRYVVENPSPVPALITIAINQHTTGGVTDSWRTNEVWNDDVAALTSQTPDPFSAPDAELYYPIAHSYRSGDCTPDPFGDVGTCSSANIWHGPNSTTLAQCYPGTTFPTSQTNPAVQVMRGSLAWSDGTKGSAANPGLRVLVPAASGGVPGRAYVQFGIPGSQNRTNHQLIWQNLNPGVTSSRRYETYMGDLFEVSAHIFCGTTKFPAYDTGYATIRWRQYLASASTVVTASIDLTTLPGTSTSATYGDARLFLTSLSINNTTNN